jgi:hypothetical protein
MKKPFNEYKVRVCRDDMPFSFIGNKETITRRKNDGSICDE